MNKSFALLALFALGFFVGNTKAMAKEPETKKDWCKAAFWAMLKTNERLGGLTGRKIERDQVVLNRIRGRWVDMCVENAPQTAALLMVLDCSEALYCATGERKFNHEVSDAQCAEAFQASIQALMGVAVTPQGKKQIKAAVCKTRQLNL